MDYHLHSLHSMDGEQTLDELCQSMAAQGVQEICLTEHIEIGHPMPGADVPPLWDVWQQEIRQCREKYPMLIIRMGVEIGDYPPYREQIKAYLQDIPFDFRLLSLHLVDGVDPYFSDYFAGKTRAQAYCAYAEAKAESIAHWTDYDSVAHIGYVAKYSIYTGEERPLVYADAPDALDSLLQTIIHQDKCLEINTSGYGTTGDILPHSSIVRRYIQLGGENFTFGSDSHNIGRNYANIERAKDAVRAMGGKYQASFEQRERKLYRI